MASAVLRTDRQSGVTITQITSGQSVVNEVTRRLRERAAGYFSEFAGHETRIQLTAQRIRANSVLCAFLASTDVGDHRLLVKLACPRAATTATVQGAANSRPRLFPLPDSDGKAELEFSALSRIYDHFSALDDSRFGALRPLDYLPDERALVLEHVPHRSLSHLLTRSCRVALHPTNLDAAFRNAGAWLREYHQLPGLAHTRDRHETRADFVESFREFATFLAAECSGRSAFGTDAAQIESLANSMLPCEMPLGMSHGDFAPRNIFVGSGQRVVVFDTLARWRAPIYEDIAHFLVALKLSRAQVYSLGVAFNGTTLARYEAEFLHGYFENAEVPLGPIQLFEKLLLMDKWSALIDHYQRAAGVSRLVRRGILALWSHSIRRQLDGPISAPALQSVRQAS
jgi:hypothetical protein